MHVIIPDDYQAAVRTLDCFRKLDGHSVRIYNDHVTEESVLVERLSHADALVLIRERTPITASLLEQLPALRLICQTGKSAPHVDLAACTRHGIAVTTGGGSPVAPAELTWALILAAARHIPLEAVRLRAGQWQSTLGRALRGRTLGIWGYGQIGTLVAGYGRAFGMEVLVWGRHGTRERAATDGFKISADEFDLFRRADVLSLHLRMLPETRAIVTGAHFAAMKPSALFVNTSRAGLVAAGALEAGLESGRPGYAAVDVYESEPVLDHPLFHMNNVVATPHLGYVEKDTYEDYFSTAFDQVNAFAAGSPLGVLNPEVLR